MFQKIFNYNEMPLTWEYRNDCRYKKKRIFRSYSSRFSIRNLHNEWDSLRKTSLRGQYRGQFNEDRKVWSLLPVTFNILLKLYHQGFLGLFFQFVISKENATTTSEISAIHDKRIWYRKKKDYGHTFTLDTLDA